MTCPKCGEVLADNATVCSFCGEAVNAAPQPATCNSDPQPQYIPPVEEKPENVAAGIVGAMIGALIGGVAIILLGLLGYVASICGLIMAVCALKGYQMLGGKLSTKGIVISVIFMLIVPVVSYFIGAALSIVTEFKDYGVSFMDSLTLLLEYAQYEPETQAQVLKDLLMLYGFTALGAFGTIANALKKKK